MALKPSPAALKHCRGALRCGAGAITPNLSSSRPPGRYYTLPDWMMNNGVSTKEMFCRFVYDEKSYP